MSGRPYRQNKPDVGFPQADSQPKSSWFSNPFSRDPIPKTSSALTSGLRKYSNEELQSMLSEKQFEIDNLTQEVDSLRYGLDREKKQSDMHSQQKFDLEMKVVRLESEMSYLEEERNRVISREKELKTRLNFLQEQADSKEQDTSNSANEVAAIRAQMQEREDQLATSKRKLQEAKESISQITMASKHLQEENDELRKKLGKDIEHYRNQENELKRRIQELENHQKNKHSELSFFSKKLEAAELELQKQKDHTDRLTKELEERAMNDTRFRSQITCLEKEKEQMNKQMENMSMHFERDRDEREATLKKERDVSASCIRDLEQTLRESQKKIEQTAKENQSLRKENQNLNELRHVLEAQDKSKTKDNSDLKTKMAALEASSDTRQKMLQKDIERLTEQHISDIRKQEERHAAEKKEMQAQIETFLQVLNDDKQVERETIQSTIQQVARTNAVTNQILQAAFRTHQRRYRPATNIRELDDDL